MSDNINFIIWIEIIMLILIFIYSVTMLFYSYKIDNDLQSTKCTNGTLKTCNRILLITLPTIIVFSLVLFYLFWTKNQWNIIIFSGLCFLILLFYTVFAGIIKSQASDKDCQGSSKEVSTYINILLGISIGFLLIFLLIFIYVAKFLDLTEYYKEVELEEQTKLKDQSDVTSCQTSKNELESKIEACERSKKQLMSESDIQIEQAGRLGSLNCSSGGGQQQMPFILAPSPQYNSGHSGSEKLSPQDIRNIVKRKTN